MRKKVKVEKIFDIVFLDSAEQDMKDLRAYIIKNFSQRTWVSTFEKIKLATKTLQRLPLAGTVPDEMEKLNLTQYRQILSGMNRIIYEVRQDTIYIHVVVDARREMSALLTRRLLRVH